MNRSFLVIFYILFIIIASLSILFIPQALNYNFGSEISIVILFFPLGYMLWDRFGFKFFLKSVLLLSIFALSIEYIGLTTGFPYSNFIYTGSLGYKIAGVLPWTVSFSWVPLMVGSVALVYVSTRNKLFRIFLPVIILILFDLLLDPVAVNIGIWKYANEGAYFGIPIQNFFGWAFSGLIGSIFCYHLFNNKERNLMHGLWYSFLLSVIFWSIIALGKELFVPFVFGFILLVLTLVIHFKYNEEIPKH